MSDATRPNSTAREEGRFFAPVSFERHCADCHQLNFAGQTSENLPLPHYASSAEFKRLLSLNFRVDRLKGSVAMATDQTLDSQERQSRPETNNPVELDQTIVDDAVRSVFQRCQQCHLSEDINEQVEGSALQRALVGKNNSLIPDRWLQYGYYDHAAHPMIHCDYCHPGTRSRDELTSQKIKQIREDNPGSITNAVDQYLVKINSVSSCLPCHRDSDLPDDASLNTAEKRKLVLGEARQPIRASNACTLCHRYHWSRPLPQVAP